MNNLYLHHTNTLTLNATHPSLQKIAMTSLLTSSVKISHNGLCLSYMG